MDMASRFKITWIVENGHTHYKIHDNITGEDVHCDESELMETINDMTEEVAA